MSMLEIIASALGLACVWLTIRRHIACWPTGLVMVVLYIIIFYRDELYSGMLLQVVFVPVQIYGWYAWLHGGPDRTPLVVSRLPAWQVGPWIALCAIGTASLGRSMQVYAGASFPYVDALQAVASLIAQWLLGRKVLESWLVWIFVDVVCIGLYLAKELYPTAILYSMFLVMAGWGWFEWKSVWKKQATA